MRQALKSALQRCVQYECRELSNYHVGKPLLRRVQDGGLGPALFVVRGCFSLSCAAP
jgi:hypothetical protein